MMSTLGSHWKRFVVSIGHVTPPDLPKLSEATLHLMTSCPVARPAILDLFSTIIDDYMFAYSRRDSANIYSEQLYERGTERLIMSMLQKVVFLLSTELDEESTLVMGSAQVSCSSGSGFISFASRWVVHLLGQLSNKYGTAITGHTEGTNASRLEESLSRWIQCPVVRELLKVAEVCLQSRSSGDEAMTALLSASGHFSTPFDWVIAHLGSRHPAGIFQRVVMCTLNDFSSGGNHQEAVNKFHSALSVLNHLGGQHAGQLKTSLSDLIERALSEDFNVCSTTGVTPSDPESKNLIPFLLSASSGGHESLRALVTELTASTLERYLSRQLTEFISRQGFSDAELNKFRHMVVDLLLTSTDRNTGRVVEYLVLHSRRAQVDVPDDPFTRTCRQTLVNICTRLLRHLHSNGACGPLVPSGGGGNKLTAGLVRCPQPSTSFLINRMMAGCSVSAKLLLCRVLAEQTGLADTLIGAALLQQRGKNTLNLLFHLVDELELSQPGLLNSSVRSAVETVKTRSISEQKAFLVTLMSLLKHERRAYPLRPRLAKALSAHADALLRLIYLSPCIPVMNRVIAVFEDAMSLAPCRASLAQSMAMTRSVCSAVALLVDLPGGRQPDRNAVRLMDRCGQMLVRLAALYPLARAVALRCFLHEIARQPIKSNPVFNDPSSNLLLKNPPQPASQGQLLSRKRPNGDTAASPQPSILRLWSRDQRWLHLLSALASVRDPHPGGMSGHRALAEALQDTLLSDTLAIKTGTLEMDPGDIDRALQLYKRFETSPVLWGVFDLLSRTEPPVLGACCALLQALLGALVVYWNSSNCARRPCRDDNAVPLLVTLQGRGKEFRVDVGSFQYRDTTFLINCLRRSCLLPARMSKFLDCLLPHLSPFEMHCLLAECRRLLLAGAGGGSGNEEPRWDLLNAVLHNHITEIGVASLFGEFIRERTPPPGISGQTLSA